MSRKITVSINADVTIEATKEVEETMKKMRRAEEDDNWDLYCELENKLEELLSNSVYEGIKNIKDVNVLDVNWE